MNRQFLPNRGKANYKPEVSTRQGEVHTLNSSVRGNVVRPPMYRAIEFRL